ncbi:MAG: hypothetical protein Q9221_008885 [Calogaya cf. arnoldii]
MKRDREDTSPQFPASSHLPPLIMPPFTLPPHLFNPSLYTRLLTLWFSDLPLSASAPTPPLLKKRFSTSTTFDAQLTSTFLPALQSLSPDKYPLPPFTTPEDDHLHYASIAAPFLGQFDASRGDGHEEAALALVLLLDQIPRNVFRTQQSLIYGHYDRISRAVAEAVYVSSLDVCTRYRSSPPYRMWFYMPLMHSEKLEDHGLMGRKLEDMERAADGEGKEYLGTLKGFEERHRGILDRFGRYPYRNEWMGREETEEERVWLREGGETFGTG